MKQARSRETKVYILSRVFIVRIVILKNCDFEELDSMIMFKLLKY